MVDQVVILNGLTLTRQMWPLSWITVQASAATAENIASFKSLLQRRRRSALTDRLLVIGVGEAGGRVGAGR